MSDNLQKEKRAARARARQLAGLTARDPAARAALGLAVSRRLAALEAYRRAAVVLAFAPMGTEADITPFLRRVLADGKRLCLPACTGPGVMEAREAADLALLAPAGAYGILEPAGPAVPPEKIDLAVVPCLAAGRDHTRLGRGGGYYDRYLPKLRPGAPAAAVCAAALLWDTVPAGPLDAPVALVVTEEETL